MTEQEIMQDPTCPITKYVATTVAVGALAFGVVNTSAVALTGNVNFGSDTDISLTPVGTTDFNLATGVHFGPGSGPGGANATVTSVTAASTLDAVLSPGDWITFSDFPMNGTAVNIWTGPSGSEFDLAAGGIKSVSGTGNSLTYEGAGTVKASGYDDTPGYFTFTTQKTPIGETVQFSFSAVTAGQAPTGPEGNPVPDGGATAALLSLGLLTLGSVSKRRA